MNRTISGFVKEHFKDKIICYQLTAPGHPWVPEYYSTEEKAKKRTQQSGWGSRLIEAFKITPIYENDPNLVDWRIIR